MSMQSDYSYYTMFKQLQKRADRGHPRIVMPLETTESGELNYPVIVGKGINEVIIEDMGEFLLGY